eukprot:Nk52_evm30s62 gene=Nk52_evmTU30s62
MNEKEAKEKLAALWLDHEAKTEEERNEVPGRKTGSRKRRPKKKTKVTGPLNGGGDMEPFQGENVESTKEGRDAVDAKGKEAAIGKGEGLYYVVINNPHCGGIHKKGDFAPLIEGGTKLASFRIDNSRRFPCIVGVNTEKDAIKTAEFLQQKKRAEGLEAFYLNTLPYHIHVTGMKQQLDEGKFREFITSKFTRGYYKKRVASLSLKVLMDSDCGEKVLLCSDHKSFLCNVQKKLDGAEFEGDKLCACFFSAQNPADILHSEYEQNELSLTNERVQIAASGKHLCVQFSSGKARERALLRLLPFCGGPSIAKVIAGDPILLSVINIPDTYTSSSFEQFLKSKLDKEQVNFEIVNFSRRSGNYKDMACKLCFASGVERNKTIELINKLPCGDKKLKLHYR